MGEPKLRFKADDGSDFPDWEEMTLGELFHISAGGDIDKNNCAAKQSKDYPYPVYANALVNNGTPDSTCKCNGWFRVGLF